MSDADPASNRRGRIALAAAAIVVSALYAVRVHDPDAWWHLATGRWIIQNHAIPRTDPFSFTANGEPWIYVNWLPDAFYYLVFVVAGFAGLVLSKVAVAAGLLGAVGAGARAAGARWPAAIASMIAVGTLAQIRFALLRPNALGGLLLALSGLVLLRWMARRDRSLWLLAVLAALWLPTHGSAVLALGVALVAVVATALDRSREGLRRATAVFVVVVGLFVVFPSGRHIIEVIMSLDKTSNIVSATIEWRRIDFLVAATWMPTSVVILGLIGGLRSAWLSRSIDGHSWAPLGLAFGAVYLVCGYERNLAEALVMAGPGAALVISALSDWAASKEWGLIEKTAPVAAVLVLAGGHFVLEPDVAIDTRWGFDSDETWYPNDSFETLAALPAGRTINNFGIGGYLIWREVPGGVFSDGRTLAVYTDEIFDRDIMPTMRDQAGLDDVAERFDVTYGLASSGSLTHRLMMTSQSWIPVFHGQSSSLFVRATRDEVVTDVGRPVLPELRWDDAPGWADAWYRGVLSTPTGAAYLGRSIAQSNLESPNNPVLMNVVPFLSEFAPAVIDRARNEEVETWPSPPR